MEKKIEFAPNVVLIDAAYMNKVVADMRAYFTRVLNRQLPEADLACLLECVGLDAGIRGTENAIQVILIYDASLPRLTDCVPADLEKDLNNVAFKGSLGEFSIYAFQPSEMATREDLFIESVQLLGECKETKRIAVIPSEACFDKGLESHLKEMKGKEGITVLGMNKPAGEVPYDFQLLGFSVLRALGVHADELR